MPESSQTCAICGASVPMQLGPTHLLTHRQRGEAEAVEEGTDLGTIILTLAMFVLIGVVAALIVTLLL